MKLAQLLVGFVLVGAILWTSNVMGGAMVGEDSPHTASVHGHAAEVTESHDQPASEKLLWGIVMSCVSVVLFALGNDGYTLAKSYFNGARHLWGWSGQWVARSVWGSLFVPDRFREQMYLTLGEEGYTLSSKGRDEEGGGWGILYCTSGKHPVGTWELRANRDALNLPELTITFKNGRIQAIVFERVT